MHSSVKRFFSPGRLLAMIALLFAAGTAIIRCTGSGRIVKASAPAQRAHTLVIDAGHGGLDGGAVSVYGDRESAINLSIAKRLYGLCRLCGAECIMTRYDEDLPYPQDADSVRAKKRWDLENRVELCNSTDGAILVSIHQNRYPDARPSGTQVLYAQADGSAGRPLKGWAPYEPVIAAQTQVTVCVIPAHLLGSILREEDIHRPEYFRRLTGRAAGDVMELDAYVRLIAGEGGLLAKGRGERILVLTHCDDDAGAQRGRRIAQAVQDTGTAAAIVYGSLL